jgi:hypothetical protein
MLINSTITEVAEPVTEIEERDVKGCHLILAAFTIYVGSGVSCSLAYCSS